MLRAKAKEMLEKATDPLEISMLKDYLRLTQVLHWVEEHKHLISVNHEDISFAAQTGTNPNGLALMVALRAGCGEVGLTVANHLGNCQRCSISAWIAVVMGIGR